MFGWHVHLEVSVAYRAVAQAFGEDVVLSLCGAALSC